MTHTLQIIYGGTTVDLNDGSDIDVMAYQIGPVLLDSDNAVDTIRLRVLSTSISNLQAEIAAINRALTEARQRQSKGRGNRVYLKRQLDSESNTYRSEILEIRTWPDDRAIDPKPYWSAKAVPYMVQITRVPYWENNSETELELSNNGGTAATGGQTVYNPSNLTPIINGNITISYDATDDSINDSANGLGSFAAGDVIIVRGSTSNDDVYTVVTAAAGKLTVVENLTTEAAGDTTYIYDVQNYVHIAAAQVAGDVPTPCRVEITNSMETNSWQYHIGHNILSNPASLSHVLEAEHADSSSITVSATNSGGEYITSTWATDAETTIADWTLPTPLLNQAAGGDFRVIARFQVSTNVTDTKFRLKVLYGTTVIYSGAQVQPDSAFSYLIRDLGVVTLPPWLQDSGTIAPVVLRLTGQIVGGTTITLDCLALHCLDGYRYLEPIGTGIPGSSRLVDDGILGELYVDTGASTARAAYYNGVGKSIMLKPNAAQRLYFMTASSVANTAEVDRASSIRIYYRDRRLTI